MSSEKLNIFVSYSHADMAWVERIHVHLKPLARDGYIDLWDDSRIKTGQPWRDEIRDALAQADAAVLLISADFYASDFIANHELPPLLEAAKSERGLTILGVHIGYSRFDRDHLLSGYQTVNSPSNPVANLSRPRRERICDDLARRIEELARQAPSRHLFSIQEPLDDLPRYDRQPPLLGDVPNLPPHYIARSTHFEAVRDQILDTTTTDITMIGARRGAALVGMGGVGKTTLAVALVRDQEIQQAFPDGIAWLTFGQTPDLWALQQRLLAWITPSSDPPSDLQEGRAALDAALKRRRWLIVLDDVWRREHLSAFELADTPSRILVTTRGYGIAQKSGAATHVVDELTESAARALLAKAIGLAEADLPPVAKDVIRECGRLPLALALAGATLADAPQDEFLWHDVLKALAEADHDQLSREINYPYAHALAAIQASVDSLPRDDRTAYLQLAIFPEDTPIPLAPLEKLWVTAGLMLRNRVKLFVDRTLARRQDDGSILLHDLQGDFVRKRCLDIRATHEALLRSYCPSEGTAWADIADDGYILDWLPYHLAGAGRGEELRDLLFDLGWLRRKLAARNVQGLISDAALCADDGEVHRLGRALRMSAHVLSREDRQLPAQLLGRLREEEGHRTTQLVRAARCGIPDGVLAPRGYRHLLPPGMLVQTLDGHRPPVRGAVVLAEGMRALSWSGARSDPALRLWDLESGTSRALEGHNHWVNGAMILADGVRALSWSQDGTLRLWDLESGASRALDGHSGPVVGAEVLADGVRALSWSEDGTLRLWDLESGASRALKGHSKRVNGAEVLIDGMRALSWSEDGTLRLWDLESGASRALDGHSGSVEGAEVLADGMRALSWSADGTLRLWDLESGASRALKGHSSCVSGAVVSADGARALSWSEDGALRLWDLESGASRALEGHSHWVNGAMILADGVRALSWSEELRLWDLESGTSRALEGHSHWVNGAVLLADGVWPCPGQTTARFGCGT